MAFRPVEAVGKFFFFSYTTSALFYDCILMYTKVASKRLHIKMFNFYSKHHKYTQFVL
jgi:hypothetical protein